MKELVIPASAGSETDRYELTRQVNWVLGGLYTPSAGELRMALRVLGESAFALAEGTRWAMMFDDYVTASAVADDGHTMAVVVDGEDAHRKVVLLPERRVVGEDLVHVIGLQFLPGDREPSYLGYGWGGEMWSVCIGDRTFVLDEGTVIDEKSVVMRTTRTPSGDFVSIERSSRPSWYFKVDGERLRMMGYEVYQHACLEGCPVQGNTFGLMSMVHARFVKGNSRVLAVCDERVVGSDEVNTLVWNVSTGERLWVEPNFIVESVDAVADTQFGVLVSGRNARGDLRIVSFDGETSTCHTPGMAREHLVQVVGNGGGLLLRFRDGDMLVVTDGVATWHNHKHVECVVPTADGFAGCTRQELDGRVAACSVFTITL